MKKRISINFWVMVRDVLVHSISKGQFPLAIIGCVFFLLILKMPQNDISKLIFLIFSGIIKFYLVGYIMCFLLIPAWFVHAKFQRKMFDIELERVIKERNKYQNAEIKCKIESSKR